MGEITEALRRAKLGKGGHDFFRDSAPDDRENPNRVRDLDGRAIDSAREGFSGSDPEAADMPLAGEQAAIEIPRTRTGFWIPRAVLVEPPLQGAECFRHFAVSINRELDHRRQNSVVITSSLPEEGKTTVSCNLALAIASISGGRRTALVDLDLHRASVSRVMGMAPRIGFEDVLSGAVPLQAARIETDLPGFDLYPIATPLHLTTQKSYTLLAGKHFLTALRLLAKNYDRVVFDAPPALVVPDVALIAEHIPACVVVTRNGITKRSSYLEILSMIPAEKLIGAFLNEASSLRHPKYGHYFEAAGGPE